MGVNNSIRAYNGAISWINNNDYDLGKPEKKFYRSVERHLNKIFISFGKEHNIKMEKDNSPKYKGSYSPMMSNCQDIQQNWELFTTWIKKNYKQKTS